MSDLARLDPTLLNLGDCGCCAGVTVDTPTDLTNRPGLSAIRYRIGTHGQFLDSMLADLSASQHPELAALKTRSTDDFAIALLDGWATIADVLTFYQERIANEAFLRTATERQSLLYLTRLIGYELAPGVAADTLLAFTLEQATGSPPRTTIDIGLKVQSIPGPGETAQTFETVEQFEARVEWNALQPRTTAPTVIQTGTTELYLQGVNTQLQPGDAILIVGDERLLQNAYSEQWDFRLLDTVTTDTERNLTHITWLKGLGAASVAPAAQSVRIFALRQRAPLFGHNAVDPRILQLWSTQALTLLTSDLLSWVNFSLQGGVIDLDIAYPKITEDSWIVLETLDTVKQVQLYRIKQVSYPSRSDFALSGKVTRIVPDIVEHLGSFGLRETIAYAQSEELTLAETPLTDSVWGNEIVLDRVAADIAVGRSVAVFGKRAKVQVTPTGHGLQMVADDGTILGALQRGDLLFVLTPRIAPGFFDNSKEWHLQNSDGVSFYVTAAPGQLDLVAPTRDDAAVMELALVDQVVLADAGHTKLVLHQPLQYAYDLDSATINANVIAATHGETVQEILGAGAAGQPYQTFALRQSPLTYVSAANAQGIQSTLALRVNDILWHEVPSLYGQGPRDRVYITRTDDNVVTSAEFGDGAAGACPPTGQDNVRAVYRKGIGMAGTVKAGQLTLLLTRPLGVKQVINPQDATGGKDRETIDEARRNGPLTVLTLDRAVSLQDYEDYASAFAGIAKALATWTFEREERGIFLTVAGQDGTAIDPTGKTYTNLLTALMNAGDPQVPLHVASYRAAYFRVAAKLKIDPDYLTDVVSAAVVKALRNQFSFEARAFGQPVMLSDVIAAMQAVDGVIAVAIDAFYRTDAPQSPPPPRLLAELPVAQAGGAALAAELLTLDLSPMDPFGTMP